MPEPRTPHHAEDALLGLLLPLWQIVIGLLVAVAVVIVVYRLVRRGPSRMTTAMLLAGGAVVGITVVGILSQNL
jgi:hypothetical protein